MHTRLWFLREEGEKRGTEEADFSFPCHAMSAGEFRASGNHFPEQSSQGEKRLVTSGKRKHGVRAPALASYALQVLSWPMEIATTESPKGSY